jgi:predicted DNA-binding protein with PD1-like motif
MKYTQAQLGRVFVLRLEDGDVLHDTIEAFARQEGIQAAAVIVVGCADTGSRLVVGPRDGRRAPIEPMDVLLTNVHEIAGTGTVFPDETGRPLLHMHVAAGRAGSAVAGCVRSGVKAWQIAEVILFELVGCAAVRRPDAATGFTLLQV